MPRKKYTEGQIALVVKELENGAKVEDLCRKLGVSEATVYNWRKRFAGMSTPEVRRLKQFEGGRRFRVLTKEHLLVSKALPIFLAPHYFCACSDLSLLCEAYDFSSHSEV